MANLVQNPSFEMGLIDWKYVNVTIADENPLEGSAVARMGPGAATLFQDISIDHLRRPSFTLSFNVQAPDDAPGNLSVTVHWLDSRCRIIGTGLCMLIPGNTIFEQTAWLTVVNATEDAPSNAVAARLLFNKMVACGDTGTAGNRTSNDFIDVDLVVMVAD